MRTRLFGTIALLGILLALPAPAADDPKAKPPANGNSKIVDANNLQPGECMGKLLAPPGSDGHFTVRVDLSHLELKDKNAISRTNSKVNADMQRINQLQQQIARTPYPPPKLTNQLQQLVAQVQREQSNIRQNIKVVTDYKDVDFHAAENMIVRFLQPPIVYDEKGDHKKYTKQELSDMRGLDGSLPGYEGQRADLESGQVVKVTLRARKDGKDVPAPPAGKNNTKDKDKDKDKDAAEKSSPRMDATMIVVVVQDDKTPIIKAALKAPKNKDK